MTDCQACTDVTHCTKCQTKALSVDQSQCVDDCIPYYKTLDGTKCVVDCYNDDQNHLMSLTGNLCVDKCNEGEFNKSNHCIQNNQPKPQLTIQEITEQIPGQQTIYAICDQSGKLYYVISQSSNLSSIDQDFIINKLEAADNTTQTELGDVALNPARNIYGQKIIVANYEDNILIVGKLEAGVKYQIKMYCVNYNDIVSEFKIQNWTQPQNKGKPVITSLKFTRKKTKL
eukprot:TRINITY_DN1810_c0_g1_i6.p2 TRINITY_DN1810_c0_g1~~TRINITY_DN1810_c0_g1_i6.p2  ORF type:complete len:229 (-),score=36.38 TRINITY_DN1810_c0_g1_i6:189-875(-)